jgi:hypothetical protein
MTGGTYTNTGSTIQFNGTADQSISSTGAFNNLTVNKTAGNVNLSAAATVNGTLGFISGKVSLGANNLTLGTAGTITGATTSNYIIANNAGSLVQPVTNGGSKAFPIGTASHYIPVTITLIAGSASDNFSARVLGAAYSNGTTGTAVTNSAVNASWVLGEAVAGGTNATITLQWPLALELSGFSRSASRLAQYLSNTWNYGSSATAASGTNPYSISRAGITSLSTFAVSNFEVLPVTWLSVDGQHKDGKNIITWSTAAEWDNLYFAVEAASDGMNFTEVGQVKGGGTNLLSQSYQFEHKKILTPVTFYRVKQVDNNGQFTYSPVILIKAPVVTGVKLLSGNNVTVAVSLSITMKKSGKITALIHDAGGKMLRQHVAWLAVGTNNVNLDVQALATGVYFLNITGEDGSKTTLRIVKKI